MVNQLIECVPNFSEGRDQSKVEKIAEVFKHIPKVKLIGLESDYDHNRTVLTCIGLPEAVCNAVYHACEKALDLLDLRDHIGVHPRIGVIDVIPFIPISNITMQDCVDLAHKIGKRIGRDLSIPVFYYESAAKIAANTNLADIRKSVRKGRFHCDVGPCRLHPTAGGVAIGARQILIAFNVNLNSNDVRVARNIARLIRERDGGLPGIKALGLSVKKGKAVQVSMNITDYSKTTIRDVFMEIKRLSEGYGIKILNSELIGLTPGEAFGSTSPKELQLVGMRQDKILDYHINRFWENNRLE